MIPSDRDPCPRCGVRGDVDCSHRKATSAPVVLPEIPEDARRFARPGNGKHFHRIGGGGRYRIKAPK